jgi:Transposase IS200 like.
MSQSLAKIYVHIIFSTKHRTPFLKGRALRLEMHRYLGGTCRTLDSPSICVGGVEDHVHLLVQLGRTWSIAEFVKEIKKESSKWIKTKDAALADFHWQNGYGAFSVSPSRVEELRRYIEDQEEHHKKESFQDEFRRLLRAYGVEWDERYVWD